MTPKEQFDSCMKLAEFGTARGDARRHYEWKLTMGIWAVLVAAVIYFKVDTLPIWPGGLSLFVYACWLQGLWRRNASDAEFAWNFVNEAQQLLAPHKIKIIKARPDLRIGKGREPGLIAKRIGFLQNWSLRLEFIYTCGLMGLVYFYSANKITIY